MFDKNQLKETLKNPKSVLKAFFLLDFFISPFFIHVLYWIFIFLSFVGAVVGIFAALLMIFSNELNIIGGLGLIVLSFISFFVSLIFSRIFCEMLLAVFKMCEYLRKISEK